MAFFQNLLGSLDHGRAGLFLAPHAGQGTLPILRAEGRAEVGISGGTRPTVDSSTTGAAGRRVGPSVVEGATRISSNPGSRAATPTGPILRAVGRAQAGVEAPERTPRVAAQWAYEQAMRGNADYQESDREPRVGGFRATAPLIGNDGVGAPKCNFFVYDALRRGGIAPSSVNGRRGEIPTAQTHWSNRNSRIENFRPLGPNERPQLGDVVSNAGHVGIIVGEPYAGRQPGYRGWLVASAATQSYGDRVTLTSFKFRPQDHPDTVVFWRHAQPRPN